MKDEDRSVSDQLDTLAVGPLDSRERTFEVDPEMREAGGQSYDAEEIARSLGYENAALLKGKTARVVGQFSLVRIDADTRYRDRVDAEADDLELPTDMVDLAAQLFARLADTTPQGALDELAESMKALFDAAREQLANR